MCILHLTVWIFLGIHSICARVLPGPGLLRRGLDTRTLLLPSLYSSCSHEDGVNGRKRRHQVPHLWWRRHALLLLSEQCILGGERRGNSKHAGGRPWRGVRMICWRINRNVWNVIAFQQFKTDTSSLVLSSSFLRVALLMCKINLNPTCSGVGLGEICARCFPSRFVQDVERVVDFGVRWRERAQAADGADDGHVLVDQRRHALAVQVSAVAVVTCHRTKIWHRVPVFNEPCSQFVWSTGQRSGYLLRERVTKKKSWSSKSESKFFHLCTSLKALKWDSRRKESPWHSFQGVTSQKRSYFPSLFVSFILEEFCVKRLGTLSASAVKVWLSFG